MIFVCTGTQIYQFNRLLEELDRLIENGKINDEIFAQIGASTYTPKNFSYKRFLSYDEFNEYQDKANLIISHAGTGALIGASKKGKNIIAIPRLAKFGEHIDDHQLQVTEVLEKEGYVRAVYDINRLCKAIEDSNKCPIQKAYCRESNVIKIIEGFINESVKI